MGAGGGGFESLIYAPKVSCRSSSKFEVQAAPGVAEAEEAQSQASGFSLVIGLRLNTRQKSAPRRTKVALGGSGRSSPVVGAAIPLRCAGNIAVRSKPTNLV